VKTKPEIWTAEEESYLEDLNTPFKIQQFLDTCDYNSTTETRSPRYILSMKRAHCLEGALFAAVCLEYHGFKPLVLDLQAVNDDDHVIAIYRMDRHWGAVAKSNFTTLRFREPVYRSLRELAMSYFDFYFNTDGDKTLRGYSLPQNLSRFDKMGWRTTEADLEDIGYYLDRVRHIPLVDIQQINRMVRTPMYLLESSLIGSDPKGLFIPGSNKKTKS
jgi:hypothetical protein